MQWFYFRVEVQDRNGDGDWEVWEFEQEAEDFQDALTNLRLELAARTDLNDFSVLSGEDEFGAYFRVEVNW